MAKTTKTTEPIKEQAEVKPTTNKTKWDAGKYKILKTYCGLLGVFQGGKVYELTKEQAEAFGNAGEIEKC